MLIKRPQLIERIRPFYNDHLVKVITGLRRTGKSSLLRLIADDLKETQGRSESSFLFLNFESIANQDLLNPVALYKHIAAAKSACSERLTVFLDDIQNVPDWESCVNSLRADDLCEIFITGSNSKLLSGELATHLAGRTIQFQVFPFSFAEFCEAWQQKNNQESLSRNELWQQFLVRGGMPGALHYSELSDAHQYLRDVFEGIALKDVAQRWSIRQTAILETVFKYLMSEAGHRISAGKIEKYLKSKNLSISRDTLLEYLYAGAQTYAFERLESEDFRGRKIRRFQPKVYLADHGFREAHHPGSNVYDIDQTLENIVCIELLRRGWTLTTGDANGREIDFIAERNGQRLYVQVAYLLASETAIEREFAPLMLVQDNWPKMVLSMDQANFSRSRIVHQNILDFLLGR